MAQAEIVEAVGADLTALEAKAKRDAEEALRRSYPMPPHVSVKRAFVVITYDRVGQAGNLIPVGTCIETDARSGAGWVMHGRARYATKEEIKNAIPEHAFKRRTITEGGRSPESVWVTLSRDLPGTDYRAGDRAPLSLVLDLYETGELNTRSLIEVGEPSPPIPPAPPPKSKSAPRLKSEQ